MGDMIQRYEEEAEAFYQATGVMAPGKDAAAAMHGYDADELRHKLWRMWARAVYAERERDEMRQRADRAERILAALREPSLALEAAGHQAYVLKIGQIYADEGHVARHHQTLAINSAIRAAVAAAEKEVGRE